MENKERVSSRQYFSELRPVKSVGELCAACGAEVSRDEAKFCRVCGKLLTEDYQPLDTLRASYKMQGKQIVFKNAPIEKVENLFEKNENSASTTAWAFAVYSLVPYLGILFCPGAVLVGSYGVFVAHRNPHLGGRRVSFVSIIVGFVVFTVQIFLWWLLYIIPTLGKQF